MAFNKLFSYAEADIPRRSGHDEFHRHAFTLTPGTLTPTFWDFVVPGDIISVAPKFHFQMPPQATDFIGRINLRTELFYVPMRTMWAGFKDFISYPSDGIGGPAPDDPAYHAKYLPGALLTDSLPYNTSLTAPYSKVYPLVSEGALLDVYDTFIKDFSDVARDDSLFNGPTSSYLGAGSLLDYLGFKISSSSIVVPKALKVQPFNYISVFLDKPYDYIRENSESIYSNLVSNSQWNTIFTEDVTFVQDDFSSVVTYSLQMFMRNPGFVDIRVTQLVKSFNYQGFQVSENPIQINNITIPFAYHKIYNDWYMDKRVMKPLLPNALTDSPASALANIAYMPKFGGGFNKKFYEGDNLKFYDGKSVFDLRQRLWQKDYFTTMTTQPQAGEAASVTFDTTGNTGEFTIASLRVANAMQLWRERMNLVDPEYSDAIFAQYGVYPDDSVTGKAIYLGSCTQEVYNKSVYQQGDFSGATNNPINSVGAKYASPMAVGGNSLCNDYHIREHGIVMAITSLVPEAMYSTGTRRQFHYDSIDDIAFPLLQGVGDQAVYAREIVDTYSGEGDKTVIGFQQRYTEYRFINDNVSGLLRDGQSLEAFALQRSFTQTPELGSSFLEIPKTYLDQVSAVGIENSKFGAWVSSAWNYRKASRFSALASMPTLGHMKNTETISVVKAGKRL